MPSQRVVSKKIDYFNKIYFKKNDNISIERYARLEPEQSKAADTTPRCNPS